MELRDKNGLTLEEFLAQYNPGDYKRPSVTADVVILVKGEPLKVLLIQRGGHPYLGCYAMPGGFSNDNETIEETAARELEEETHLTGIPLEMVKLFTTPGRDPRMWVDTCAFVALLDTEPQATADDDASAAIYFDLKWTLRQDVLELHLAHDDIKINATLKVTRRPGIQGEVLDFKQIESEIAFDHAEEIAYSLAKAGYLK